MKPTYLFISTLLILGLASLAVKAQDCEYYPTHKGAVTGFQNLDAKGKITSTTRSTVLDVEAQGLVTVYKVKTESWDEKDRQQQDREYTMKCENGTFSVDMQSMIDPKSLEGFKDMEVSFSGTDMVYPAGLSVGQVLPDANITIGAASGGISLMKMTITVSNRKVEAIETVTVPAGTFECYKISYDLETKLGIKVSTTAIMWLNKGAGCVKVESYDKKGKLLGSTILKEFKS